jgi:SAM-dependent methyltransferase
MLRRVRSLLTAKFTRKRLSTFLEAARTDALILEVGAKDAPYQHLFPNAIRGDISRTSELDTCLDAHHLPFPTAHFSTLLCTEVLEHCHDPQQVLNEFYRVLRPGGKLILTTRFIFPIHDAPHDYYRYTRYGLAHLCRQFTSVSIQEEAASVETLGVLLQRLGYQATWNLPLQKIGLFLAAQILFRSQWTIREEYGDIEHKTHVQSILASGYYVIAIK